MADKVTTTQTLGIGLEYTDTETTTTKTVYLKVENPRTGLTKQQITEQALKFISGTNPILMTPQAQQFDSSTAIATAYIEDVEKTEFDIGVE